MRISDWSSDVCSSDLRALPSWCLRLIVLVEARAAPRLRTVEGLWRRSTRTRPGRMTDFIRAEELLPAADIDATIHDELGRASGTERVWQYEWIQLVTGTIKQKTIYVQKNSA